MNLLCSLLVYILFCRSLLSLIIPFLICPFHLEPLTCKPDTEFLCEDGSACIKADARCNFMPDCLDGSDERDCGKGIIGTHVVKLHQL